MLSQEMIEYLHNSGAMPDWAYYQQARKSPMLNLQEQTDKFLQQILNENDIQKQLEDKLGNELEKLLSRFFEK